MELGEHRNDDDQRHSRLFGFMLSITNEMSVILWPYGAGRDDSVTLVHKIVELASSQFYNSSIYSDHWRGIAFDGIKAIVWPSAGISRSARTDSANSSEKHSNWPTINPNTVRCYLASPFRRTTFVFSGKTYIDQATGQSAY
jgi:hypothetical protein